MLQNAQGVTRQELKGLSKYKKTWIYIVFPSLQESFLIDYLFFVLKCP